MDGLEKLDQSHAVFSGLTSVWMRGVAFFLIVWFAHFVGGNIYNAPNFIDEVRNSGLDALKDLQPFSLIWLPVEWIGTMLMSFNHVITYLYIGTFVFAFVSTMRREDFPLWAFAAIIVGQPLDTFLIRNFDRKLSGVDLVIALVLLGLYLALALGSCYWWYRLREDHEEYNGEEESG